MVWTWWELVQFLFSFMITNVRCMPIGALTNVSCMPIVHYISYGFQRCPFSFFVFLFVVFG